MKSVKVASWYGVFNLLVLDKCQRNLGASEDIVNYRPYAPAGVNRLDLDHRKRWSGVALPPEKVLCGCRRPHGYASVCRQAASHFHAQAQPEVGQGRLDRQMVGR